MPIDNSTLDPNNPSCISNQSSRQELFTSLFTIISLSNEGNGTSLQYGGTSVSPKSSVIIFSNSLLSNRTYQFMVYMENRRNASLQATGYLLVQVDDTHPQMIVIG